MNKSNINTPFVKWVGGKRQLLSQTLKMESLYSKKTYNEAMHQWCKFIIRREVRFHRTRIFTIINDVNKALMNAYRQISLCPNKFLDIIENLDKRIYKEGKDCYYQIRNDYNKKLKRNEYDVELAAMFVFLNKHCFNGLYRVNVHKRRV